MSFTENFSLDCRRKQILYSLWLKHSSMKRYSFAPKLIFKYFADPRTVSSGEVGITPLRLVYGSD